MSLFMTSLLTLVWMQFSAFSQTFTAADVNCGNAPIPKMMVNSYQLYMTARIEAVKCVRLKTGEKLNVILPDSISPSGVGHKYRLTKTGPKSFKSEINLKIIQGKGPRISKQEMNIFKDRLRTCLQRYMTNVPGPNGETLSIELGESAEVPTSTIQVSSEISRPDSGSYPLDAQCPIIVHEILHLHGLADEYRDQSLQAELQDYGYIKTRKKTDSSPSFSCRHVGLESSIMNDPEEALKDSHDWEIWSFVKCETNGNCAHSEEEDYIRPVNVEVTPEVKNGYIQPGSLKVRDVARSKPSLLETAHFLAITRPGCAEENRLYYLCVSNAYSSKSRSPEQAGKRSKFELNACNPTPVECKDPGTWLNPTPKP